ncbi:MAG: hypothetical protein AAFY11_12935 [Cyanobacteria bacterium J06641_5]
MMRYDPAKLRMNEPDEGDGHQLKSFEETDLTLAAMAAIPESGHNLAVEVSA